MRSSLSLKAVAFAAAALEGVQCMNMAMLTHNAQMVSRVHLFWGMLRAELRSCFQRLWTGIRWQKTAMQKPRTLLTIPG